MPLGGPPLGCGSTGQPIGKESKTSPTPKVQPSGSCAPSVHAEGVAQRVLNTFNAGQVACEFAKVLQSVKHHASCGQRRIPIQVSGPVDSIDNRGHNTKVIVRHTTGHTQEGLLAKLLAESHLVAKVQRERTAHIMVNGISSSATAAHYTRTFQLELSSRAPTVPHGPKNGCQDSRRNQTAQVFETVLRSTR